LPWQVPDSHTPHFKMHLKPGTPDKPNNTFAQAISRAGEGPGLQVAPGSVTEVRVGHCSSGCCDDFSVPVALCNMSTLTFVEMTQCALLYVCDKALVPVLCPYLC
jgi:hypothetical protein